MGGEEGRRERKGDQGEEGRREKESYHNWLILHLCRLQTVTFPGFHEISVPTTLLSPRESKTNSFDSTLFSK